MERQGLLERDIDDCIDAGGRATHGAVVENTYLVLEALDALDEDMMQTLPTDDEPFDDPVGKVAGFSLHPGVATKPRVQNERSRDPPHLTSQAEGGYIGTYQ